MINILSFTFGPFQENTYVLVDETKKGVIIDPGCSSSLERKGLLDCIADEGIDLVHLLNTHCHLDHIAGNYLINEKFNLPLTMHKLDIPTLHMAPRSAEVYGIPLTPSPEPEVFIEEGDIIKFGNSELKVIFTPGHAPGHVVFYNEAQNFLIAGDTLFQRSIGRTDLPGGDHNTLIESIKSKIFALPENTIVYCGHGPSTTIGEEKRENPFLV